MAFGALTAGGRIHAAPHGSLHGAMMSMAHRRGEAPHELICVPASGFRGGPGVVGDRIVVHMWCVCSLYELYTTNTTLAMLPIDPQNKVPPFGPLRKPLGGLGPPGPSCVFTFSFSPTPPPAIGLGAAH